MLGIEKIIGPGGLVALLIDHTIRTNAGLGGRSMS